MKQIIAIFILTFMLCGMLISCGNAAKGNNVGAGKGEGIGDNTGGSETADNNGTPDNNENPDNSETPDNNENPDNSETPDNNENPDNSEIPDNNENPDSNTPTDEEKPQYTVGYQVGNLAPSMDVEAAKGGTVNIEDYRGKVVVINLWGEWCYYCRVELPDFSAIASEYEDVAVIAIHSDHGRADAPSYISTNFPSSEIIFAYDNTVEEYYTMLGGTGGYPRTLVLDKDGVVTYARNGAINYETLEALVKNAGASK